MTLWHLLIQQYRLTMLWLTALSIASALSGVAVIAFINTSLVTSTAQPGALLAQFVGLIILSLVLRFITQYSLTVIGHKFVFDFRNNIIQRVMCTDVATTEQIGSARILASLSKDIDKIQSAFINLPAFVQSSVLTMAAFVYLGYLALDLLSIVVLLILSIAVIGSFLVKQVYQHFKIVRTAEDSLYQDFESIIYGRKELTLNKQRARLLYKNDYLEHANTIRKHIIYGDTYHLTALNWADAMVLASIGIVFFLSNVLHWADITTATTFAITILFLKSPLIQTIGTIPNFLEAQVSFQSIKALDLQDMDMHNNDSIDRRLGEYEALKYSLDQWQKIELKDVFYRYTDKEGVPGFGIGPIDVTLNRGDVAFLIGGNGSGKSTFAKLITGLYLPTSGDLYVDGQRINAMNIDSYQNNISAVYSDLYLFNTLVGTEDTLRQKEKKLIQEWLVLLNMQDKLTIDEQGNVLNTELSQGQKKRLAMLLAVVEQRDFILLDEWAADQDPQFRRVFYHTIIPKLKAMGKTLIVISHDDHYFEQADRLLLMKDGTLHELVGQARSDASRDAISLVNDS